MEPKLEYISEASTQVLKNRELQLYEGSGIYSSRRFSDAVLTFSMPLLSPVEIVVESWNYDTSYTISLNPLNKVTFKLPAYPAHYTVIATFQGNNCIYNTEFSFHIGDN